MKPQYILSRLFQMALVLVGVSILVFVLTRVLPGDPVAAALGERASAEQIAQLRTELGLDKPLIQQYFQFVSGLFNGQMGYSLVERRDVAQVISDRLPATLELVFVALAIAVVLGVPLGVLAAVRRDRAADSISRVVALAGVSFPQF